MNNHQNKKIDLPSSTVLVTNDDGIYAPGIKLLTEIAEQIAGDVKVVAPEAEQSAQSHSITLHRPLRVRELGQNRYSVNGTPTDCVIMAVHHVMKAKSPHLVLSGVNYGGNLAEDVHYSGTVSAAKEAAMLGFQSIAISLACMPNEEPHWNTVRDYLPDLIKKLTKIGWAEGVLLNINFPNIPYKEITGYQIVSQGQRKYSFSIEETKDPRGNQFHWISSYPNDDSVYEASDLTAIADKAISITPLHIDLTHSETIKNMKTELS